MLSGTLGFWSDQRDHWHPLLPPTGIGPAGGTGAYYLDFSEKADYQGPFDKAGIPLTPYGGQIGQRYYAIDISQYALGVYERWRLGGHDRRLLEVFIAQAEWLTRNLHRVDRDGPTCGFWMADFDWHGARAPWPSAMAQGQGISVLTRAFGITKDASYLQAAEDAANATCLPVEQRGVTRFEPDGTAFFEELPLPSPSRILNGCIFAYWGLIDLLDIRPDAKWQGLASQGLEGLLKYLPRYDLGFWTRYSLEDGHLPVVSSAFYQRLHVNQMAAMYTLTRRPAFAFYAERWRRQLASRACRALALPLKVASRLVS